MMGMAVGRTLVAGVLVIGKWLVALESRMAHRFMVSASMLIVLRSIEAAMIVGGDWTRKSKMLEEFAFHTRPYSNASVGRATG
jgi:hypothetical protein